MASNTSPSWQEPALLDVEAAAVADVAAGAEPGRGAAAEQRLSSRQLLQLNAETMFLRRRAAGCGQQQSETACLRCSELRILAHKLALRASLP